MWNLQNDVHQIHRNTENVLYLTNGVLLKKPKLKKFNIIVNDYIGKNVSEKDILIHTCFNSTIAFDIDIYVKVCLSARKTAYFSAMFLTNSYY